MALRDGRTLQAGHAEENIHCLIIGSGEGRLVVGTQRRVYIVSS